MSLSPDVVTFAVIGIALIGFGVWSRRHLDDLIQDDLMPAPDEEEYEYRDLVLYRGAVSMIVVGAVSVLVAVFLAVA